MRADRQAPARLAGLLIGRRDSTGGRAQSVPTQRKSPAESGAVCCCGTRMECRSQAIGRQPHGPASKREAPREAGLVCSLWRWDTTMQAGVPSARYRFAASSMAYACGEGWNAALGCISGAHRSGRRVFADRSHVSASTNRAASPKSHDKPETVPRLRTNPREFGQVPRAHRVTSPGLWPACRPFTRWREAA
jgi:hypothetical protein